MTRPAKTHYSSPREKKKNSHKTSREFEMIHAPIFWCVGIPLRLLDMTNLFTNHLTHTHTHGFLRIYKRMTPEHWDLFTDKFQVAFLSKMYHFYVNYT